MTKRSLLLLSIVLLYVVTSVVYISIVRPYHMRWGATDSEVAMSLPGDDAIPPGAVVSTRGITIHAPAEDIWPWLMQLGQERGGWYSHYWLENLFAANMHNADELRSEWPPLQVGDRVAYLEGGALAAEVTLIETGRTLSMAGWTLFLQPIDAVTTRLIVRYPSFEISGPNTIYYHLVFEPAHFIMEAGMMMGIKHRAEAMQEVEA